jgi:hypothetical protein
VKLRRDSLLPPLAALALASCSAPPPPPQATAPAPSVDQQELPRPVAPTPPAAPTAAPSEAPFIPPGEMALSPSSVGSTSAPSASTASSGALIPDDKLYSGRILTLNRLAETNNQGSKEAQSMGFLGLAMKYSESASYHLAVVECLKNQLGLGVPFYQGQATCSNAVSRPSSN